MQSSDGIPAVTLAGTISHAPFGGPSGWQFWNQQTVSVGRDPKYRITRLQSSQAPAGAVAQDLTLTYNTANLVTVITDNTAALSESFGYDKLYRLVNSTGSYGALVWKYDATGNRTKQTLNTTVSNLAYPTTNNRLTSVGSLTRQYDAAGNLRQELRSDGSTRSYAYNALGRLSAVTRTVGGSGAMPVASYYHNALGQRVAKYVAASGQWTYYVYDLDGKLLVEQPGNSTAHRDYVYLDALPLALIDVPVNPTTQATKAYAIHTDHLGTPMRLTDTTGTVVWALDSTPFDAIHGAFGLPNEDVDLNGISTTYNARFPGQYFDVETGLNYNYFRDYDPSIGRYIQSDPIGLAGGLNTYGYVGGNPLRSSDPSGLLTWTGTQTGGAFFTAGVYFFNLTSECVNGQRGHVRVTFVGAGLGLGVNVSATASSAGFKDPYLFINPSSFNGEGWIASAGVALPGAATPAVAVGAALAGHPIKPQDVGASIGATKLGEAGRYGIGPQAGFEFSIGALYGTSTVTSSSITNDCNCQR
ncbi:MAG: RHS domain-containing protein [Gammaproteobacteria bacterium]|nr:RHS domain-containing protein [Gammaproteobacteria bacterium]